MDKKDIESAQKMVHELVSNFEDVMEGKQIACIIPALIFLLAELYDEKVLPKETYISEIAKSLNRYLNATNEGEEAAWLH
jgi:hypothetical protein